MNLPQYFIPVPVRATPISITVVAVTMGGNTFFKILGDRIERRISRRPQRAAVPNILQKKVNWNGNKRKNNDIIPK